MSNLLFKDTVYINIVLKKLDADLSLKNEFSQFNFKLT